MIYVNTLGIHRGQHHWLKTFFTARHFPSCARSVLDLPGTYELSPARRLGMPRMPSAPGCNMQQAQNPVRLGANARDCNQKSRTSRITSLL